MAWRDRFDRTKKSLDGAGISTLIESLKSPDSAVSWPARQFLEAQPRKAVPALIRALENPSPEARRNAAQVMGTIASQMKAKAVLPGAVPGLVKLLADRNARVAFTALMALAAVDPRNQDLIPALMRHTRNRNPLVSGFIDEVWEEIGLLSGAASAALIEASRDPDPVVRGAARKARRRIAARKRHLAARIPRLLRAVDAPGNRARSQAIFKLFELAPYTSSVLPGLVKALKDSDHFNRLFAAIGLGAMGTEALEAVPALAASLKDPEAVVGACAAEALGKIGSPEALTALTAVLENEDPDLRAAAADAIEEIRSLGD